MPQERSIPPITASASDDGTGYAGIYNNFVISGRVLGWAVGTWSDNLEVSWISQCIFRENKSGHVAFVRPDTISPNKQPNANTITDTTFDQAIFGRAIRFKRDFTGSMTAGSRTLTGSGFSKPPIVRSSSFGAATGLWRSLHLHRYLQRLDL